MTFPVDSTSVETAEAKRAMRVLQRTKAAALIDHAGCYNCRSIAGTSTPSQHSYGNADDLFPKQRLNQTRARAQIFHTAIWQATHKTLANRGKPLRIAHAINHDARLIWTPSEGVHAYTGDTGDHVHLDYFRPGSTTEGYSGPCGPRP